MVPDLAAGSYSSVEQIEEVLVALRRVIRATDLHSKYLARTSGLTAPQILVLQAIRDRGRVTIGELARQVSLSQATVTSIMDRLVMREFVYRERSDQDKRKVYACLTERGREMLKSAPTPLQQSFARRFADLHNWEQTLILASLQRVAHMMDADDIDASPVLDVGNLDRAAADERPPAGSSAGGENLS